MYTINRAIAVIKPKQPFLDWINSLSDPPDDLTLEELQHDCTAILIPEYGYDDEAETFIEVIFSDLFAMELDSWYRDENAWPRNRDYATFREWFTIEIHSMVFDLFEDEIIKEEY